MANVFQYAIKINFITKLVKNVRIKPKYAILDIFIIQHQTYVKLSH
jgi:hypothetical protein